MEKYILDFLKVISWPGVWGLFVWKGLPIVRDIWKSLLDFLDKKIVKNNLLPQAESDLTEIKTNHLHKIQECLTSIGIKMDILNSTLVRMETSLNQNGRDTEFIKAKLTNGRSN